MISLGGPNLGLRERVAAWRQYSSGQLAQGAQVEKFERDFSSWVTSKHGIATNSGTSALHLGLLAMGIGAGDEVIVPSFTFAASANAIALTGARPIFCDIEPRFFTIDPTHVKTLIGPKTKAIMAVHLYGQMADMAKLAEISVDFKVSIVEDAAQAHGASLNGSQAGSLGAFGAFSFYPTKNMTTGEGGMITTSSDEIEGVTRLLRNQGMRVRYQNERVGFNNRMTEVAAAVGNIQLSRIDDFNARRRQNAEALSRELASVPGLTTPAVRPNSIHSFHQYTILVDGDRDKFASELQKLGVSSGVYYPTPVHRLPSFGLDVSLPVTDLVSKQCLSLPVHPKLRRGDLRKIANSVKQVMGVK